MKINNYRIVLLIMLPLLLASCSDYLDVQPEDELLETQIYNTESGTNSVLNDVYLNLCATTLYGGNLTMSTVDLLAQRYSVVDSRYRYYNYVNYAYQENDVKNTFEGLWTSAYNSILNLNDLLNNVDKYNILSVEKSNIIKGEALGLRAMIHFDMLRLFGPIYSESPNNLSIPYYTKIQASNGEILPANEVLDKIIEDLLQAEELLVNDPILNSDGDVVDFDNPFYFSLRNLRFNFYAVKALQARVYLYAGRAAEANEAAKFVIEQASSVFPWTNPTDVVSAGSNPDRVFSSEIIFGLQNVQLYARQNSFFSSAITDANILAPHPNRLTNVFEANENDYRFNPSWKLPVEKTYKTFYKFADVPETSKTFRYLQPLIRMSEMYYIAAETEGSLEAGLNYLNTVRFNRGLPNLNTTVDLTDEIQKEYQKEFFGEGQLFFYYKRNNLSRILNGSSGSSTSYKNMSEMQYVVPLPDSESQYQ